MIDKLRISQSKVSSIIVQAITGARDRERLAWRAADYCVGIGKDFFRPFAELGHVTEVMNIRVVVRKDGTREWLNLAEGDGFPP